MIKKNKVEQIDWGNIISTVEAAKIAGLSVPQISNLLRNGKLEGKLLNRDWAVSRTSVEEYARQWHKPGPRGPRKPKQEQDN